MAKGRMGRPPDIHAAHRRAAAELRTCIVNRRWKLGEAIPSLRRLAREMKFSVGAVRAALEQLKSEHRIHINPQKRLVITRLVDSPMDGRDYVLVVSSSPIQSMTADSDYLKMIQGFYLGAGDLAVPLLTVHAHGFEHALPSGFLDLPLKGMLLVGHFSNAILNAYEALKIPVILVDHPPHGRRLGSVSVDNHAAAADATRRLLAAGHRRIAFVRRVIYHLADIDPDSKERLEGFLQALKEARIRRLNDIVFNLLPEKTGAAYTLDKIFQSSPEFTAVVCADEGIAGRVVARAAAFQRHVPKDLGVITFQSSSSSGSFSGPASDFLEIGRAACLLLADSAGRAPQIRIPCAWREKNSFPPGPQKQMKL